MMAGDCLVEHDGLEVDAPSRRVGRVEEQRSASLSIRRRVSIGLGGGPRHPDEQVEKGLRDAVQAIDATRQPGNVEFGSSRSTPSSVFDEFADLDRTASFVDGIAVEKRTRCVEVDRVHDEVADEVLGEWSRRAVLPMPGAGNDR